jgi:hypothetical protein
MNWPRDALRVRRYLDGELVDERELVLVDGAGVLAGNDAEWSMMASAAGCRWRIVIDDPAGDVDGVVVLEGGPEADR